MSGTTSPSRVPVFPTDPRERNRHSFLIGVALGALCLVVLPAGASASEESALWSDVIAPNRGAVDEARDTVVDALARGDIDEARRVASRAHQSAPENPSAYLLLLDVLRTAGDADALLEATATPFPTTGRSSAARSAESARRYLRGIELARRGQLAEARELIEGAVRYRGELDHAHYYLTALGELVMAHGVPERAALFFQRALSAEPDYPHARLGLAVAFAKLGRHGRSIEEAIRVLMQDRDAAFLDEEGVFFVPDGEAHLYRAVLARGARDAERVRAQMEQYRASEAAALATPALATLDGQQAPRTRQLVVSDRLPCVANRLAFGGDNRVAALCGDNTVLLGRWDSDGFRWTDVHTPLLASSWANPAVDAAIDAEGTTLRILYSTGFLESLSIDGSRTRVERTVQYEASGGLTPQQLVDGGGRVLFAGSFGASFQIEPWDVSAPTPNLRNLPLGFDAYAPTVAGNGAFIIGFDGTSYQLFTLPTLRPLAHLRDPGGSFQPLAVAPDGSWLARTVEQTVELYDPTTGRPFALIPTPDATFRETDYLTGLAPIGTGMLAVWSPESVAILRVER